VTLASAALRCIRIHKWRNGAYRVRARRARSPRFLPGLAPHAWHLLTPLLLLCAGQPPSKYDADGTGRDTYIRRDMTACYGKMEYKSEPRLITRFGEAGSRVPRERAAPLGQTDPVGGKYGGTGFERPDRFIRPAAEDYPVPVQRYTTMKDLLQDAYVEPKPDSRVQRTVSGYTGFKPSSSHAEWAEIQHEMKLE